VWRDSTWTDIAHGDSLRVVEVAAFSDAYFALLRALPELVKPASLEPAVLVAGRRVSIKIEPGGKTDWAPGELAKLVKDFRGCDQRGRGNAERGTVRRGSWGRIPLFRVPSSAFCVEFDARRPGRRVP